MSDFETIINTRRSIREYQDKEVEDEKILKILTAGMQAPGSRLGAEPWEFVIVKDKDTLAKLGEIKPRVTNAPVAIVLVANIERAFYKTVWQQDMGAAAENMLLEAVNLGLGGLWNGVAPEEERMSKINAVKLWDSGMLDKLEASKFISLAYIHKELFVDIYDFAGQIRTVNIAKSNFRFAPVMYLEEAIRNIEKMPQSNFDEIVEKYVEIKHVLKNALTERIYDRDVFMKGIDNSYHYEGYITYKTKDLVS